MKIFSGQWPFWCSGIATAFLLVMSFFLFDDIPGLCDALKIIGKFCEEAVSASETDNPPLPDWGITMTAGIFLGAAVCHFVSGEFRFSLLDGSGSAGQKIMQTIFCGILGGAALMTGVLAAGNTFFGETAQALELDGGAWLYLAVTLASASLLMRIFSGKTSASSRTNGKSGNGGKK